MEIPSEALTLPRRDKRGSRLRCLQLTQRQAREVARLLTQLVQPFASVSDEDVWMPRGLLESNEARLGEVPCFLSADQREAVMNWWLKVRRNANTPNWDMVSTCTIEGRRGLILVEAKAHSAELDAKGKSKGNEKNDCRIRAAIGAAGDAMNAIVPGWNLSAESHYQLCNRFAWSWKIATLGVPVILLYLGFLNAEEMADRGRPFRSAQEWSEVIQAHARGIVPDLAWNRRLETIDAPMYALIRTLDLDSEVAVSENGGGL